MLHPLPIYFSIEISLFSKTQMSRRYSTAHGTSVCLALRSTSVSDVCLCRRLRETLF